MAQNKFSWIPFYKEFAEKLLQYKSDRKTLLEFIYTLDVKYTSYLHEEDGRKLDDICPFTLMGIFNRGTTYENRTIVAEQFKEFLNISVSAPTDFEGIPVLNNQKSHFFGFSTHRKDNDIENLWSLFEKVIKDGYDIEDIFNKVIAQFIINVNITMGLYWIKPDMFLALDSQNRQYLKQYNIIAKSKVPPFKDYYALIVEVKNKMKTNIIKESSFPEFSYNAWKFGTSDNNDHSNERRADFIENRNEVIENLMTLYHYAVGEDNEKKQFAFQKYKQGKWFVVEKVGDKLLFGPSRFVGYKKNTIEKHMVDHGDGTETNENFLKSDLYFKSTDITFLSDQFNLFLSELGISKSSTPSFLLPAELNELKQTAHCYYICPTHCSGYKAEAWKNFLNGKLMAIGWEDVDYTNYSIDEIKTEYNNDKYAKEAFTNLKNIKYGDIICCTHNNNGLWGIGVALSTYKYHEHIHYAGEDNDEIECYYSHYVDVAWIAYKSNSKEYIDKKEFGDIGKEKYWQPYGTLHLSKSTPQYIINYLFKNNITPMNTDPQILEYISLLQVKKQIIFQGAPGTGKTYTAKDLAEQLLYSEVSVDKNRQADRLKEKNNQFKLIQFHPAYTYEDFVRGIIVDTTSGTGSPDYKTINKPLAHFAAEAYKNWIDSQKTITVLSKERIFELQLEEFKKIVDEDIANKRWYKIDGTTAVITEVSDDSFRFTYEHDTKVNYTLLFSDLHKMNNSDKEFTIVKDVDEFELYMKRKASYYFRLYKSITAVVVDQSQTANIQVEEQNYVLIIDEINRANLPAVLGELIYGLEYRGEKVDSMYAIDGDHSLILPPNLFIIGTMNTADRSVGMIDYAIRRRFAFVDMLPKALPDSIGFNIDLFKDVSSFFIKNIDEYIADDHCKLISSDILSDEFRPEDVWIGHSYFIMNDKDGKDISNMRVKYEIIAILKEYVKDGIFKDKIAAETKIDTLLSYL